MISNNDNTDNDFDNDNNNNIDNALGCILTPISYDVCLSQFINTDDSLHSCFPTVHHASGWHYIVLQPYAISLSTRNSVTRSWIETKMTYNVSLNQITYIMYLATILTTTYDGKMCESL